MTINPNNKAICQVILLFHLTDEDTEVTELDVCPYKLTVLFSVLLPLCFDPIFFSHGYGRPGTWLSQDFERYFSYLIFKRSYILKYTFDHHTMVEATDCAQRGPHARSMLQILLIHWEGYTRRACRCIRTALSIGPIHRQTKFRY